MPEKKDRKKILIIDDEKDFTDTAKMNLEETGDYEVKTENEAINGLTSTETFKPDLILLDIVMPDMEGSEVVRQIKTNEKTKHIPIIFLTGIATKNDTELHGGIIGGYPFIAKPASLKEIIERIEENIQK